MRNKKISKLVDPSFRLYFLVGFLFAAVTVRVSIPLAICEAAAMAFLWWYFRHTAQKRREGIRQYIDDVTDDMTTADKASMLSAPFAMMVFRPDTQEILWSNDSFMQLTGVREDIFDNRIDDILPDFPTHWLLEGKSECPDTVMMGGRHFRVFGNLSHPSSRRGGQSLLATTYWTDVTEQDSLREENESRRPIVSVIVIDNYEELMKAGSEASRSAVLAAIDEKISTWLKDSHSLLRKFDRNRYVLVTTEQEYQKLLEGNSPCSTRCEASSLRTASPQRSRSAWARTWMTTKRSIRTPCSRSKWRSRAAATRSSCATALTLNSTAARPSPPKSARRSNPA